VDLRDSMYSSFSNRRLEKEDRGEEYEIYRVGKQMNIRIAMFVAAVTMACYGWHTLTKKPESGGGCVQAGKVATAGDGSILILRTVDLA
jgi:hypothetical protein